MIIIRIHHGGHGFVRDRAGHWNPLVRAHLYESLHLMFQANRRSSSVLVECRC